MRLKMREAKAIRPVEESADYIGRFNTIIRNFHKKHVYAEYLKELDDDQLPLI